MTRGAEGGGVDLWSEQEHGRERQSEEDPADRLRGQSHESRGHPWSERVGEGVEEGIVVACGGHHERHGEQHGEGAGKECENGAEAEVGRLHAVVIVVFAFGGGKRGIVAGGADCGDEGVGIDGRGGGDLRGVRHEVDVGRVDARNGFERTLDVNLAGGAGHALDAERLLAVAARRRIDQSVCGHALADSTKAGYPAAVRACWIFSGAAVETMRALPTRTSSACVPGSALRVWVTRRMQEPQCMLSMRRVRVAIFIGCANGDLVAWRERSGLLDANCKELVRARQTKRDRGRSGSQRRGR